METNYYILGLKAKYLVTFSPYFIAQFWLQWYLWLETFKFLIIRT